MFPLYVILFHVMPFLFGAAYEGTTPEEIKIMKKLARAKKGMKIADLGSGDGRIVREFARSGADAEGYEINPLLVVWSRWLIRREGLQDRAKIYWKSFWDANLGKYDAVVVFQVNFVMPKLRKKLEEECMKGTEVISNHWKIDKWKIIKKQGDIYLYEKR